VVIYSEDYIREREYRIFLGYLNHFKRLDDQYILRMVREDMY